MAKIILSEVIDKYGLQPKGRPSGGEQGYLCPVGGKVFDLNYEKNFWKCFHQCTSCTKNGGNAYHLWCMLNGINPDLDYKKTFRQFMLEFEGNQEAHAIAQKQYEERERLPEDSPKASDGDCHKAYSELLAKCRLTKEHHADLIKRGLTDEQIKHFGFKSIPQIGVIKICKEIIASGISLNGVPGFFTNAKGDWSLMTSGSGYFIPYKNAQGQIVGLQVRYDINIEGLEGSALKDAKKRRYRWVTSSGAMNGTAMKLVPYLGEPRGNDKAVYITEGGLKAMCAASLSKRWFAAIPGINTYGVYKELLEYIKSKGIDTIVDAWDTDRNTNISVQNSINNLYKISEEYGFKVVTWDAFMNGSEKGCDDYLLANAPKNKKGAASK